MILKRIEGAVRVKSPLAIFSLRRRTNIILYQHWFNVFYLLGYCHIYTYICGGYVSGPCLPTEGQHPRTHRGYWPFSSTCVKVLSGDTATGKPPVCWQDRVPHNTRPVDKYRRAGGAHQTYQNNRIYTTTLVSAWRCSVRVAQKSKSCVFCILVTGVHRGQQFHETCEDDPYIHL